MFTWECPKCGREVDVAEQECPHCNEQFNKASADDTADRLPRLVEHPDAPAPQSRTAFTIQPTQLALFFVILIGAVLAAVYLSRPDMLAVDDVSLLGGASPPAELGRAFEGSIEIAGIRYFYDDEIKPRVRAVVINHGENEKSGVELTVELRTLEAAADAMPLATFAIRLAEPLAGRSSTEIETELTTAATIQAMPSWERLRVDVKLPWEAAEN